jgi:hypothetical protein
MEGEGAGKNQELGKPSLQYTTSALCQSVLYEEQEKGWHCHPFFSQAVSKNYALQCRF